MFLNSKTKSVSSDNMQPRTRERIPTPCSSEEAHQPATTERPQPDQRQHSKTKHGKRDKLWNSHKGVHDTDTVERTDRVIDFGDQIVSEQVIVAVLHIQSARLTHSQRKERRLSNSREPPALGNRSCWADLVNAAGTWAILHSEQGARRFRDAGDHRTAGKIEK